jgi:Flp pilus assembly protein TadG
LVAHSCEGLTLKKRALATDSRREAPVRALDPINLPRRQDRESGQAMVEFALILLPLLTIVAGIIYFGIGLNYWLDMNRIANQGARWAVVNNWPSECLRTDATCTQQPACAGVARTRVKLQNTLKCMATTTGLQQGVRVDICYPAGTNNAGDPVRVRLQQPYKFFFLDSIGITLTAKATMRLEQPASMSKVTPDGACT